MMKSKGGIKLTMRNKQCYGDRSEGTGRSFGLGFRIIDDCMGCFHIVVIRCHNKKQFTEGKFVWIYGSRGLRVHHGTEAQSKRQA